MGKNPGIPRTLGRKLQVEGDPLGIHRADDEGAAHLWGEHYFITSFVPQDLYEVKIHEKFRFRA